MSFYIVGLIFLYFNEILSSSCKFGFKWKIKVKLKLYKEEIGELILW